GSGVASLFAELMSKADFESYGWRIPFIIGFFIGIIGLYIRTFLDESETFKEAKELGHLSKKPLKDILSKKYRGKLLIGLGAYMGVTIPFYLLTVFMNSFMSKVLGYSVQDALLINTICMFVLLALLPFSAILSDKIGRKPVLVASSLAYIVFAYPIFYLVALNSFYMALLGVLLFAIVVSFYVAVIPTLLVEIFPTSIRYTGVSLA
ncbi:MAG: MFS transporter, partial [Pirellulaceae bacterium]